MRDQVVVTLTQKRENSNPELTVYKVGNLTGGNVRVRLIRSETC